MNARSVTAHIDEIQNFVSKMRPIMLSLTEARVTIDISDHEIDISNYVVIRVNSKSRQTGGVVCYIRKDVNYKVIDSIEIEKNVWFLALEIMTKLGSMVVASVYHSPSGSHANFINFVDEWCENNLRNLNRIFLLMGDFNINWNSGDYFCNRLKKVAVDNNLKQLVGSATRVTLENSSTIDLVFTNNYCEVACRVLQQPMITDHHIIEINCGKPTRNELKLVVSCKEVDYNLFRQDILNISYNFREPNIDIRYNDFYKNCKRAIEKHMPKKEIIIKRPTKSWFSNDILCAIKVRDNSYKKYILTRNQNDWNMYKENRNRVVSIIRKGKQDYYLKTIDRCRSEPQLMWKTLKRLLTGKNGESYNEINFNGVKIKDRQSIANHFNNYFVNSIHEIVNSITFGDRPFNMPTIILDAYMTNFTLIDKQQLKKIIFSMPNKSSPDELDIHLWKGFFNEFSDPLINIINSSLLLGIVPNKLKLSTIVPIRKIAATKNAEEFRPINMLASLDKIMEKIVYTQLIDFVTTNNILTQYQSGFREGHSCESAFQFIINDWKDSLDNNDMVVIGFLDLKRAFETVDRARLLRKLENYGVRGSVLDWLKSYLESRYQNVKCGDILSHNREINIGVPQGSILGPLLFILYINDIGLAIVNCKFHLFADDTLLYLTGGSYPEMTRKMNEDLCVLSKWFSTNKLKLNVNKTKCMLLAKETQYKECLGSNVNVKLDGNIIEFVDTFKYLGIIVDRKLDFHNHIDYICSKIAKKLGILSRCGQFLSKASKLTVYNTIILPHFYFAGTVLYLVTGGDLERLQKLQNKAMRIILCKDRYAKINDMLKELGWINVAAIIEIQVLTFIHKINLGIMPDYLKSRLIRNDEVHSHETRYRDFCVQYCNKSKTQKSVFYKGIRLYNKLDRVSKQMKNVSLFKKQLLNSYKQNID